MEMNNALGKKETPVNPAEWDPARHVKLKNALVKTILYLALVTLSLAMLLPILWMISTSLKLPFQVFVDPPQWIPSPPIWRNYYDAWNAMPFDRFFLNSIFVSVCITFGQVYVMTQGGPSGSTMPIVYYIYSNAFQWFRMGYASAIAWVLCILMFGLTLLQWRLGKKFHQEYHY